MRTLVIGGGNLGGKLAKHYSSFGKVDVITRSFNRQNIFESLGCGHYARDIANSTFSFDMDGYDLVIFTPAVTIDAKVKSAARRLHVNGAERVMQLLKAADGLEKYAGHKENCGIRGRLHECTCGYHKVHAAYHEAREERQ